MDWPTPDGRAQPGLALRVAPPAPGRPVRAIVVDQNVYGHAYWPIQVITFDGTSTGDLWNMKPIETIEPGTTVLETISFPDGSHVAVLRSGPGTSAPG